MSPKFKDPNYIDDDLLAAYSACVEHALERCGDRLAPHVIQDAAHFLMTGEHQALDCPGGFFADSIQALGCAETLSILIVFINSRRYSGTAKELAARCRAFAAKYSLSLPI